MTEEVNSKIEQKLQEISSDVKLLFEKENDGRLLLHNYVFTREIADIAKEMSEDLELGEEEALCLRTAAWFSNTGYLRDRANHLQASAEIAEEFMQKRDYREDMIKKVKQLCSAVGRDKEPGTPLERLLNDAYWSFLGRKRFFRLSELWRLEYNEFEEEDIPSSDWLNKMRELLVAHKFYSDWGMNEYSSQKNKNILKLRGNILKIEKKNRRIRTGKDFGRGIDTLYRNTLRGHLDLSSIADGKANIIISINTLILSILITAFTAGFSFSNFYVGESRWILIPVLTLMLTSLTATIFAVLSAIPKYSKVDIDMDGVEKGKVSLLFFNNFLQVDKDYFVEYLRKLKGDESLLYDNLARDVYNLGGVLKRKYRLLNISYKVFVGGLALSFVVMIAVLYMLYGGGFPDALPKMK